MASNFILVKLYTRSVHDYIMFLGTSCKMVNRFTIKLPCIPITICTILIKQIKIAYP